MKILIIINTLSTFFIIFLLLKSGALSKNNSNLLDQDDDYQYLSNEDYEKAKDFVITSNKATASALQSKFGWGFPKANSILMSLEENDVISQIEDGKRKVLMKG